LEFHQLYDNATGTFARGFIVEVTGTHEWFLAHAEAIFRENPVERVTLTDVGDGDISAAYVRYGVALAEGRWHDFRQRFGVNTVPSLASGHDGKRMEPPPGEISGLRVLCYSAIDERHRFTGNNNRRFVSSPLGNENLFPQMAGLAICQGPEGGGILLVGCDRAWQPQWSTACVCVDYAKDQAEFEYEGVNRTWQ
jgi:hypothetical protein